MLGIPRALGSGLRVQRVQGWLSLRGTIQRLRFRELRRPCLSSSCSPAKLLHQGQSPGAFPRVNVTNLNAPRRTLDTKALMAGQAPEWPGWKDTLGVGLASSGCMEGYSAAQSRLCSRLAMPWVA